MTYPIDGTIPDEDNDPLEDVAPMRTNFLNTKDYLSVDHVTPGAVGDGYHKQVTYNNIATPGAQSDPQSIAYTVNGVADPTHPQHVWKNSQGVFPLSAIRAYGSFLKNGSSSSFIQQYNCTSITQGPVFASITLDTNVVNTSNYVVLLFSTYTFSISGLSTLSYINKTTSGFDITGTPHASNTVSFLVLEF